MHSTQLQVNRLVVDTAVTRVYLQTQLNHARANRSSETMTRLTTEHPQHRVLWRLLRTEEPHEARGSKPYDTGSTYPIYIYVCVCDGGTQ